MINVIAKKTLEQWVEYNPWLGRIQFLTFALLGAIVLALSAKFHIAQYPVSITMHSFAIVVLAAIMRPSLIVSSVLLYLIAGALGFSVFYGSAEYSSQPIAYMCGPIAGYLVGFVFAAVAVSNLSWKGYGSNFFSALVLGLVGELFIHIPGTFWLYHSAGFELMMSNVAHFVPLTCIKISFAGVVIVMLKKAMGLEKRV